MASSFELGQIDVEDEIVEPQERAAEYLVPEIYERLPGADSYLLVAERGEHSMKIAEHTRATCQKVRVLKIVRTEFEKHEEDKF